MGATGSNRTGDADQSKEPSRDQSPQPVCVVLSSESTPERAEALARALLERRLVACVSLLPVRSLYRWQGKLETADEVKLLLKTSPEQLEPLHQALHALHSYQTPEWILLSGSTWGDYGAWLAAQLA